jgi:hypothetical protein
MVNHHRIDQMSVPTALGLLFILALLLTLPLVPLPLGVLLSPSEDLPACVRHGIVADAVEHRPGRRDDASVLLDEPVEVAEERVRRAEEVKLVVPAFFDG